jgi:hypothetical protein
MNQEIRNTLRNLVTQCRKLLEDSVLQELEGKFGIFAKKDKVTADPDASTTHLTEEEQESRKDILDHFGHIQARGFKAKDALDQLMREIAFTHLNRLCAYKMMEAREVYIGGHKFREAVSRGVNSNGVKFYLADHSEEERLFNTGHQDVAYRRFLDWLGGLLSEEIGVLFNPNDPANRLYPRQKTLDEVLDLLNGGGIKPDESELKAQWPQIWSQDETIGWVYQYFTPKELRDQARKESSAPRNSYELAFRNQFFTPRYIVEFLTDNTLGRIWYEMRKGDTKLKDQCRYMVHRQTESFMKEGQQPPKEATERRDDLSQEELFKLPVHIPHRAKRDPRELKILDPACGSGHFLLYCFDLLVTIYEEAYSDPDLGPALKKDYATLEDLQRDAPRLILAHNLHGIDIDQRASQIAALALWLRCQRAYQDMGLKKDRPKITRSNFVCAEPMPGEEQMLKEFVGQLEYKFLGQVVEVVFDKMKLAGEAGSLLKIEEEIRDAVAAAKKQWVRETTQATDRKGQPLLFTQTAMDRLAGRPEQSSLFDLTDITNDQFFEQAEAKVIEALRQYAEKTQNGQRLQRRLFADDAVRGFSFVDLCQKDYDVVLINPPFGASSKSAKALIEDQYPKTKNDLYAAFVERGVHWLLPRGMLGAITSRTGFFLSSFQKWREDILLDEVTPTIFGDLGSGVLDTAMVETAAYCVEARRSEGHTLFFRLTDSKDKDAALRTAIVASSNNSPATNVYAVPTAALRQIPGSPFAYWVSSNLRSLFKSHDKFESNGRIARQGAVTGNDARFVRSWWEIEGWKKSNTLTWVPFAKSGITSAYYCDVSLVVPWDFDRGTFTGYSGLLHRPSLTPANASLFFRPGLTWPLRAAKFCPSVMPSGCVFSIRGYAILAPKAALPGVLGVTASSCFDFLFKMALGRYGYPEFVVGVLQNLPYPALNSEAARLNELALSAHSLRRALCFGSETDHAFYLPDLMQVYGQSLTDLAEAINLRMANIQQKIDNIQQEIDDIAFRIYELSDSDRIAVVESTSMVGCVDEDDIGDEVEEEDVFPADETPANYRYQKTNEVISYFLGCALGRWNIRFATGERELPKLPDPFDPLPICSSGMLQAEDGLPLRTAPRGYPLRIDADGLLVDDPYRPDDILRRIRDGLEVVWKSQAESIEKEACDLLGVKELRDYFRKPGKGGFWIDHVSRYSKSRRKAPIYWLLQSSKRNYAIWLYYHRLDKDLLFKALVNYVEPKIRLEASNLETIRGQKAAAGASGKEAKQLAADVERQEEFLSELRDFEDKLRRAANLHLVPDLNDGVVLNIALLWELVPWKEAKNYWEELLEGKYEWSSISKQLRQKGLVK